MTRSIEFREPEIVDAQGQVEEFLKTTRGSVDDIAADEALTKVISPSTSAFEFASDTTRPVFNGHHSLLNPKDSAERFSEFNLFMAGRVVVAGEISEDDKRLRLYPAMVSPDSIRSPQTLKLHILESSWNPQAGLSEIQRTLLSGLGQADTDGVGDCKRPVDAKAETEHFISYLNGAIDSSTRKSLSAGRHPTHEWRSQSSVLDRVSKPVQGESILPNQIRTEVYQGKIPPNMQLFWHESLMGGDRKIETGDQSGALLRVQGIGYLSLKELDGSKTTRIDNLKRMVS